MSGTGSSDTTTSASSPLVAGNVDGKRGYAIKVKPGTSVPERAVSISSATVANMKFLTLKNKPLSERWPVYGSYYITGATWLSTAALTFSLRYRLRLSSQARLVGYVLTPFGPSITAGLIYGHVTQDAIQTGKTESCALCLPTRVACCNIIAGWFLPTVVSLMATQHYARMYYTYPVPPINYYKPFLQVLNKVTYKLRPQVGISFVFAAVFPIIVTILEKRAMDSILIRPGDCEEYTRIIEEGMSRREKWGNAGET